MRGLFYGCSSLKELDLSKFNTDKVTDMSYMFYNCFSLEKLNICHFKTNKVRGVSYMFYECSSLKDIIFPFLSFTIYNIRFKHMQGVCDKCPKLRPNYLIDILINEFFGLLNLMIF